MTRFFAVLFVLLATQGSDARQPWPPKDLGNNLQKDLSAAYWHASDNNPRKFPYPDEVESLFYDLKVRTMFWGVVNKMMEIGDGKLSAEDSAKVKAAYDKLIVAIASNRRFARMPALKQRKIAKGVGVFATTEIATRVIYIHSLAEAERYIRQKKGR